MSEKNDDRGGEHDTFEKKEESQKASESQKTKRILNAPIFLRVWEVQEWLHLDCTGCGREWRIKVTDAEDKEPYGFTRDHLNTCPGYSSEYSVRRDK